MPNIETIAPVIKASPSPEAAGTPPQNQAASSIRSRPDASPVFNRTDFLARMMNDESMLREVQEAFLGDMPGQLEAIKGLVTQGEAKLAGKLAHRIKGAAAAVSGEALRDIAAAMEDAGAAGNQVELNQRLPELEEQFRRLRAAMEAKTSEI